MKRYLRVVWFAVFAVLAFSLVTVGQETTGVIEVTVKDEAAAVVPNATVTIEGTGTTSFKRTATTDDSGFVRVLLVPPGEYSVTVAAISGFAERQALGVKVGLGKTIPVAIVMGTNVNVAVTVTSNDTGLDLTDDKGNTNLSAELVGLIPKGINFTSVLKYSAATRPEPRSGQFQIDGASGAENTFVVDGQEVTDISSGFLNRNVNLPLSILQETQVKTTGFEAEFGGALGGVINIVTKSGNNDFHGEFGLNARSWRLEPTPLMGILGRNNSQSVGLPVPSYYPSRRSPDSELNPTASLLGPIWKDRVWFSVAYAPQIFERERELIHTNLRNSTNPAIILPPQTERYSFYRRAERFFGRVDARPFDKLNLNSTFKWSPEINRGSIPGYTAELAQGLASLPPLSGSSYTNQTGGRINSLQITGGGSYVLTDNIVVSARIGHYFFNNKLGTYGTGSAALATVNCLERRSTPFVVGSTNFPTGFGCQVGTGNNYPRTFNSLFDTNIRDQFDVDAIYSFDLGGRHEIKGGYQRNAVKNDSDLTQNDLISLYYGRTVRIGPLMQSMLQAISGVTGLAMSPEAVGAGSMTAYASRVNASSTNNSYFLQDRWQPSQRLTLTLGVRMEDEKVPSPFEGVNGLKFGLESKIAPRLGASYDLRGDGKTKIFGFYGLFYDRFKLGGPGRTFAASETFVNLFFEILPADTFSSFNRSLVLGANPLPTGNSQCPTTTTTPIFGRVRCVVNNNTVGEDDENLDPDTKPFQQREITFGVQHQFLNNYMLYARYSRKQVINAIEDTSFPLAGAAGNELFITGNPGKGLIKKRFEELGLIAPLAQRQYDLLEIKLDRRYADNYFFSANYSLSRLYGNYSGLISSDEEGTRNDPNVQRVFDTPAAGFTAAGGPDNGRLATDRPHVFKAFGTYTLPWTKFGFSKRHSTDFQMFYTIGSGSQITSFINVNRNQQIILTKRGDQGRTPVFSQTDFAIRHNIKFGKDGRFNLKLDADIINLWNQATLVNKGLNPSGESGNLINETTFNPLDLANGLVPASCISGGAAITTQACWALAYRAFQDNGSQNILNVAQGAAGANPFYNAHHTWQALRNVRYGITLTF